MEFLMFPTACKPLQHIETLCQQACRASWMTDQLVVLEAEGGLFASQNHICAWCIMVPLCDCCSPQPWGRDSTCWPGHCRNFSKPCRENLPPMCYLHLLASCRVKAKPETSDARMRWETHPTTLSIKERTDTRRTCVTVDIKLYKVGQPLDFGREGVHSAWRTEISGLLGKVAWRSWTDLSAVCSLQLTLQSKGFASIVEHLFTSLQLNGNSGLTFTNFHSGQFEWSGVLGTVFIQPTTFGCLAASVHVDTPHLVSHSGAATEIC